MADVLYYTVIDFPFLSSHLYFCAFCFLINKDKVSLKSDEIICTILKYNLKIAHLFLNLGYLEGKKKN